MCASGGISGAILDREGKPTTDPNAFYDGGMLLPFGGHKGYALALVAEMLAARGRPFGRGRDALSAARPDS